MLRERYDSGMTVKITVSLPDELVEDAREAVAHGQVASVSAYVAMTMRVFAQRDTLEQFLADMNEELGPPGPEAVAWARAQLGLEDEVGAGRD